MHIPTIRQLAAGAAVAAAALTGMALASGPAAAVPGCTPTQRSNTGPFTNLAANEVDHTNGTFTLTVDGVKLVTPDAAAKVYGYLPLSPAPKISEITQAGFTNINTSGLAASYQIGLYIGATWSGTLVWEQIYQPPGYVGTTDVLHGGNSKWYITKSIPTAVPPYVDHTVKTWQEIVAMLPENSTAAYYGLNQGAGGIATNTVNNLKLAGKTWCKLDAWSTAYIPVSPSPSVSKSASPSPAASPTKTATTSPTATTTPSSAVATLTTPVTSPTPGLPVTGVNGGGLLAVGGGALGAGVGVLLLVRRRRNRVTFTA